jgi:hypothetical protein
MRKYSARIAAMIASSLVLVGLVLVGAGTAVASPLADTGPDIGPMMAMTAALSTTGHDVTMTTKSSTTAGVVDPADHAASAVAKGNGAEIDEIVTGGQIYLKTELGTSLSSQAGISSNVWMTVDPTQIGPDNELLIQPDGSDPVDLAGIMAGITAVRQPDALHLQGTIDLSKVSGYTEPDPDEVSQAGTAATAVPFAVTADTSGRIALFTIDADAFDPGLSVSIGYSNYGSEASIVAPTAPIPAPNGIYSLFNN